MSSMREIGRRVCLTVSRVFVWSAFHAGKRISHNERTIMKIQSLVLLLSMAMASVAGASAAPKANGRIKKESSRNFFMINWFSIVGVKIRP